MAHDGHFKQHHRIRRSGKLPSGNPRTRTALFPKNSMHMRMFDDHDEQRALARYGIQGSLAATALISLFEDLKLWWQAGEMRPEFPKFYDFMIPFREHQPPIFVIRKMRNS
jgi:hypothetical protein